MTPSKPYRSEIQARLERGAGWVERTNGVQHSVMRSIAVGDTGATTTELGFGCAGLYREGDKRVRRATLETAYDQGIRHFDVAPMYGLGAAESELGEFLRARRQTVTVATKFGISMTGLGGLAGKLQAPIRRALVRNSNASGALQKSGAGPGSGAVGRMLYQSARFDRATAERSLDGSLRALGTDHVDFLFLHDPPIAALADVGDLCEHLERERRRGRIRAWGVAAHLYSMDPAVCRDLLGRGMGCLQVHDDVLSEPLPSPGAKPGMFTFGAISGALNPILASLDSLPSDDPLNLIEREQLPVMLLRESVRRNPLGVSIFSTSKPERLRRMCEGFAADGEPDLLGGLVERIRPSASSVGGAT
jgi:D-threo-aldose 1-dehydrogenase